MTMRYCLWFVTDGADTYQERCEMVSRARSRGVTTDIIAFADKEIHGAETYSRYQIDHKDPLYPLVYLAAGLQNLDYDAFVYVDSKTYINNNIYEFDSWMANDPVHVPLCKNRCETIDGVLERGSQMFGLNKHWRSVLPGVFSIRRRAIGPVVELSGVFRKVLNCPEGIECSMIIGAVCQLLSGDSEMHDARMTPTTWAIGPSFVPESSSALFTYLQL